MTWFKDLDVPESFGFSHNQVTPFHIEAREGGSLYAWHILPIELYRQHESALTREPSGLILDITSRVAFNLLSKDPDAILIIHVHGAAGTVGSGYRVPNYRALSAGQPQRIHVLTFDYRGFGHSHGTPSEHGLILDALAVSEWAMHTAGIPPSRILFFGQSLGTAVTLAVLERFAAQSPPISFSGAMLVAPFADVPTLVASYRIGGSIPILSPLAKFPPLINYLSTFIREKWSSIDRVAKYVRANEENDKKYRLTLIHAEDDYDIPWHHTEILFWHAVNATTAQGIGYQDLDRVKSDQKIDLGAAGSVMEWRTQNGVVRQEILRTGLHDVIMGNPVVTMAVMRILEESNLI
ncbi:MAG: hypothetical protein Q9220_004344 [cf. Caloplaca sp. 1 TL-2023]